MILDWSIDGLTNDLLCDWLVWETILESVDFNLFGKVLNVIVNGFGLVCLKLIN